MNSTKYNYKDNVWEVYYPLDENNIITRAFIKNRIWEKCIVDIYLRYLNKDSVVLDIGAYLGSHSLIFSTIAKKVYSFEPQRVACQCLKRTKDCNNIDNILIRNIALSNESGFFEMGTNGGGDASLMKARIKKKFNEYYSVKTKKLDEMYFNRIDLMKIDVEDSEIDVLEGGRETIETHRPIIIIEAFNKPPKKKRLRYWVECNDYNIEQINCENYLLTPKNI